MSQLKSLNKERGALRTSLVKTHKKVMEVINNREDTSRLPGLVELLRHRFEALTSKDAEISVILGKDENVTEEMLSEEQDRIDEYFLMYQEALTASATNTNIESRTSSHENSSGDCQTIKSGSVKKYKLPTLKLREFSGELKDWLPFWGQFEKIHSDNSLEDIDKLGYLTMSMTVGSPARQLVESYPATQAMYPQVVQALKDRFGRKDLLTELYIRELLSLVLKNTVAKEKLSVSVLYDQLQCHLRNLDSLDVTMDKCASILMPLVSSCLPTDMLQIWERSHVQSTSEGSLTSKDYLQSLLNFLKGEVEGAQKMNLAQSTFGLNPAKVSIQSEHTYRKRETKHEHPTTAAALVNSTARGENRKCLFCSATNHESQFCDKNISLTRRQECLREKKACFCCLKFGHRASQCHKRPKCGRCSKSHFDLLCPESQNKSDSKTSAILTTSCKSTVLLQTVVVKIKSSTSKGYKYARLMYDSGSQQSYVLDSTVLETGYKPSGTETLQHALFGGEVTKPVQHNVYKLVLSSLDDTYECTLDVFGQSKICSPIPTVPPGPWLQELEEKNICLSDLKYPTTDIEILIGADVAGKLFTGKHLKLSCGLVAIDTSLGWTLSGKVPGTGKTVSNAVNIVTSLFVRDATVSDLWNLDVLGITDPTEVLSKNEMDKATMDHFLATVAVDDKGRFQVHLPFVNDHTPLASNYDLSMKRLDNTITKLKKDGYYEDYQKILDDWEEKEIIERVPEEQAHLITHYLPHRHVIKIGSTTPIRPVFDASAHEASRPCLNECLEKGPNLLEKIPSCLARFRQKKIGISGDIEKAFLQIGITEEDRNFLGFLWKNKDDKLIIMRHCRVVFGVTCSPFLLEACLQLHLANTLESCKVDNSPYPLKLVEKLNNSFYVDNCLTSVDTVEEAKEFTQVATSIMQEKKFVLRGWELSGEESTKPSNVLGLLWDKKDDTFSINIESLTSMNLEKITKRVILSAAHRIFDPIGIISSFVLIPKLILQQTWESKLSWNEEVDDNVKKQFLQWMEQVPLISQVKVPRWVITSSDNMSMHIFCDASKVAYSATVFLRVQLDDRVTVQLLACRARVAPIGKNNNGMTIPRLELLAATIATRLYKSVVQDFSLANVQTTFWTDASTVLAWIKRSDPWNVFVMNRVKEIRESSDITQWRHVPGHENPADIPSRGCMMKKLLELQWWEGPSWLLKDPKCWPQEKEEVSEEEVIQERKKTVISSMVCESQNIQSDWYHHYFSKYKRIVRMIGWILRFRNNSLLKKDDRQKGELSANEYKDAEHRLFLLVQKESLTEDKIKPLVSFIDKNGLIRIKTKASNLPDSAEFCHPVVLPSAEHPVVKRMITNIHEENCHAGVQILTSILRQQFWILGGRRTIHSVVNACIICKRFTAKKLEVMPTPLPENRVRNARVFEVSGCDLAGPLFIKSDKGTTKKVWVCLFTCAVYRAVRLELVSSLSTDSFLQALRRFCSRNGRPQVMYSDNGTNFVGYQSASESIDWDSIAKFSSARKIEWRFNPPSSPWWGGWWERLIGIMKGLLRRVLGRTFLNYESMLTLLSECESVINDRPLTYMSDNANDLAVLTPAMFLHELEETGVPEFDLINVSDIKHHLKHRRELRKQLRERFKLEYLGQLKLLAKKSKEHDIKIGDLVLIGDDNVKRLNWPIARVIKLFPGADGHVRVLQLRTSSGVLTRPIQRIYPLEFSCSADLMTPDIHGEQRNESDVDGIPTPDIDLDVNVVQDVSTDKETSIGKLSIAVSTENDYVKNNPRKPKFIIPQLNTTRLGRNIRKPSKLSL